MVDDSPEDKPPTDEGKIKRPPPTIDLEASEVSGEPRDAAESVKPMRSFRRPSAVLSSVIIAALSGAVAAVLVIALMSFLGWPQESLPSSPSSVASQADNANLNDLATRLAAVESRISKPANSDSTAAAQVDTLEKSLASLRAELAAVHAQSDQLAAQLNDVKSGPREPGATGDFAALDARIARIESAVREQSSAIAGSRTSDNSPADDAPLRRIVVASLLDISVRQGEPYEAALAAAKTLAPDPDQLKPLEAFAASGVPNAAALSRELLTLVPKLSPPVQENVTTGTGLVDRLQASAARLVRIERTDAVGSDRGAIVARITGAALRNDSAEARRQLNTLAPADRAAAQAWLDKANARDQVLAASHHFVTDAMAALAGPAR